MKILAWIRLLFEFLGLIKEAGELAAGVEPKGADAAPVAKTPGPARDETDKDDKFHLNQ